MQAKRVKALKNNISRKAALETLRRRSALSKPVRLIEDPSFAAPERRQSTAKLARDMFLRLSVEQRRILKAKKKSRPGDNLQIIISDCFEQEDLQQLHMWVMDHSHSAKNPNMTAGVFADEVFDQTGVTLKKHEARQLLREMGFTWEKLQPGYYMNIQMQDYAINHRSQLVPLLHWLHLNEESFTIFYQDESPFRKNIYQNMAWINRSVDEHKYQMYRRPGVGDGFNVSSYLSREHGVLYKDEHVAQHVGYVIDSAKKGASTTGKETHESFLAHLETAFETISDQYEGIPVVVIDGARTHLTFPEGRFDAKLANLKKSTDKKPQTLENWMKKHKIWNKGKSPTRTTKRGYQAALQLKEAREIVQEHPAYLAQLLACEEVAKRHGGLVLCLPAGHPMLNPIELLWRNMKNHIRRMNGPTKEELGQVIDATLIDESWYGKELQGMFSQCELFRRWFIGNDKRPDRVSDPKLAPTANKLRKIKKKGNLHQVDEDELEDMFAMCVDDYEGIFDECHRLNMMRRTREKFLDEEDELEEDQPSDES